MIHFISSSSSPNPMRTWTLIVGVFCGCVLTTLHLLLPNNNPSSYILSNAATTNNNNNFNNNHSDNIHPVKPKSIHISSSIHRVGHSIIEEDYNSIPIKSIIRTALQDPTVVFMVLCVVSFFILLTSKSESSAIHASYPRRKLSIKQRKASLTGLPLNPLPAARVLRKTRVKVLSTVAEETPLHAVLNLVKHMQKCNKNINTSNSSNNTIAKRRPSRGSGSYPNSCNQTYAR